MLRYGVVTLVLILCGCKSPQQASMPRPHVITDELVIKVQPAEDGKIRFWMQHHVQVQEKGDPESRGSKNAFSVDVEPSVWAKVRRSATVIGYSSETECLMGDEMVKVSGMPGENFTVKIEPLVMDTYQVTGIYLASRFSESGETGKTIPFDVIATPCEEITVYRKTVVFDPEARIGEEKLLRQKQMAGKPAETH